MRDRAIRVAHLTAVHPRDDVRIFAKECRALAAAGYDVHLVAPGIEDETVHGVHVHAARAAGSGRLARMTGTVAAVYRVARRLRAGVYHVHDPELLPVALLLRAGGARVIYDSHEHLPQQILTKPWIPAPLRRPLALAVNVVERLAARFLSAVVTAEPYVRARFEGAARPVVTVNNYPRLEEFPASDGDWSGRERAVCYAGSISELRGAPEMVDAAERAGARLLLAGRFSPPGLRDELAARPGWDNVEVLGQVSRAGLAETMARARAGLVVLKPVPNYLEANPTKMFEYMSAGIPVVCSNFPTWVTIVERHGCGIWVDPQSPQEIADAIEWILEHTDEAREMGHRGRRAVERLYNWEIEERALLGLYEELTR
ncbi:MAG TPA: glycosyltransferase family 4 protein [Thermoleophilaceae bacterium]